MNSVFTDIVDNIVIIGKIMFSLEKVIEMYCCIEVTLFIKYNLLFGRPGLPLCRKKKRSSDSGGNISNHLSPILAEYKTAPQSSCVRTTEVVLSHGLRGLLA